MFSFSCKNDHQLPVLLIVLLFLSFVSPLVRAQHIDDNDNDNDNSSSKPLSNPLYMGLVALTAIFFLTILYYIANICYNSFSEPSNPDSGPCARVGLSPTILNGFPIFTYANVSGHIGPVMGPLECAVCLSPYKEEQFLRLLPKCDHLFHLYCVDRWLALHTTCPICRADLIGGLSQSSYELNGLSPVESMCIDELENRLRVEFNRIQFDDTVELRQESSDWQVGKIWRSNSTGHVADVQEAEEDVERFRLSS